MLSKKFELLICNDDDLDDVILKSITYHIYKCSNEIYKKQKTHVTLTKQNCTLFK